jgi:hypothetical protein
MTLQAIGHTTLGSVVDEVGPGKDAESSFSLRINVGGQLKNLLSGNINVGGNDGEHNRPRVFHVAEDDTMDKCYITFNGDSGGDTLENSRYIDDTEVLLKRS